jgi:hypothetical protein
MNLKSIGYEDVGCIHVIQERRDISWPFEWLAISHMISINSDNFMSDFRRGLDWYLNLLNTYKS